MASAELAIVRETYPISNLAHVAAAHSHGWSNAMVTKAKDLSPLNGRCGFADSPLSIQD